MTATKIHILIALFKVIIKDITRSNYWCHWADLLFLLNPLFFTMISVSCPGYEFTSILKSRTSWEHWLRII